VEEAVMPKSILDPTFRYRGAATHDDGGVSFRRRQQARQRWAKRQAQRGAAVVPIKKVDAK
jgi:hypothetical protein